MAAKVANQGSGDNTEGPGVSYASVLNPKSGQGEAQERTFSKENNKENIGQVSGASVMKERNQSSTRGKPYQKNTRRFSSFPNFKGERRPQNGNAAAGKASQVVDRNDKEDKDPKDDNQSEERLNGEMGSDGEFQTVAPKSARRKEKLQEKTRERGHRERRRHHERHHPRAKSDGSRERLHREKPTEGKERVEEKGEDEEEAAPVKYVEAPLPVVNPWMRGPGQAAAAAPGRRNSAEPREKKAGTAAAVGSPFARANRLLRYCISSCTRQSHAILRTFKCANRRNFQKKKSK